MPHDAIKLDAESTKEQAVHAVAIQPRGWRDAWAVLRGRYRAQVRRETKLTSYGFGKKLKAIWTGPEVRDALNAGSLLRIPIRKGDSRDV